MYVNFSSNHIRGSHAGVICELSLLLWFESFSTLLREVFLRVLRFSNSILECTGIDKFVWTPGAPWASKLHFHFTFPFLLRIVQDPVHVILYILLDASEGPIPDQDPKHVRHRPLQKRERTGKEYGCFPFVWKTNIFKWKINYILES